MSNQVTNAPRTRKIKPSSASSTGAKAAAKPPARAKAAAKPSAKPVKKSAGTAAGANGGQKKHKTNMAPAEKADKHKKPKLVRDSFTMPHGEYAQIGALKGRLLALGVAIKKSELLRAGVALLASLPDAKLKLAADKVEVIKTGRPAKAVK